MRAKPSCLFCGRPIEQLVVDFVEQLQAALPRTDAGDAEVRRCARCLYKVAAYSFCPDCGEDHHKCACGESEQ